MTQIQPSHLTHKFMPNTTMILAAVFSEITAYVFIFVHGEWHLQATSIVRSYLVVFAGLILLEAFHLSGKVYLWCTAWMLDRCGLLYLILGKHCCLSCVLSSSPQNTRPCARQIIPILAHIS